MTIRKTSRKKTSKTSRKKTRKTSRKKTRKTSRKKIIKAGDEYLNSLIKKQSSKYFNLEAFKKLFIDDMSKKHPVIIKLNDINHTLKYENIKDNKNMGLHIGQRKLLLTEVQFLTKYNTAKYCIYAGSAPSNKTHLLSNMFPNIKFILVDPNIFEILLTRNNKTHRNEKHDDIIHLYSGYPTQSNVYKFNKKISNINKKERKDMLKFIETSKHKIYIWEDYMNDSLSDFLKDLGNLLFISDIRTSLDGTQKPKDFDIVWNRSMVHNWISVLQPEMSMVKFRIPYYNEKRTFANYKTIYADDFELSKKYKVDFEKNYFNNIFRMSKAELYIQPWKGHTSAEMRGYIAKKDIFNIITYDTHNIENRIFYYNSVVRVMYHINKNANQKLHFCNCNDCAIENKIWVDYIKTYKKKQNVHYFVNMANKSTSRNLSKVHNNTVFAPIDAHMLERMMNKPNKSTHYESKKIQLGNLAPPTK